MIYKDRNIFTVPLSPHLAFVYDLNAHSFMRAIAHFYSKFVDHTFTAYQLGFILAGILSDFKEFDAIAYESFVVENPAVFNSADFWKFDFFD